MTPGCAWVTQVLDSRTLAQGEVSEGFGIHRALGEHFLHQCAEVWVDNACEVVALSPNNVHVSVECFLVKN